MPQRLPPARSAAHLRAIGVIKVTAHRVTDRLAKIIEGVGFGENRVAKGTRDEAAFRRFLD